MIGESAIDIGAFTRFCHNCALAVFLPSDPAGVSRDQGYGNVDDLQVLRIRFISLNHRRFILPRLIQPDG